MRETTRHKNLKLKREKNVYPHPRRRVVVGVLVDFERIFFFLFVVVFLAKEEDVAFCSTAARAAAEEEWDDDDDESVEEGATPFPPRRR